MNIVNSHIVTSKYNFLLKKQGHLREMSGSRKHSWLDLSQQTRRMLSMTTGTMPGELKSQDELILTG